MLLYNPKSGGGKAERFSLADEAAKRGIDSVELTRGADLEQLVRDAVAGGADALAMAGGDGSQAVVASVASELDLPYACIPAGTRNHFALDLGVDRDDVVGALDALVEGGERRVDLAEVNGRVFVNNVSLGLYAEAVQRDEYRDAKIRTILNTVPEALGPNGEGLDLAWTGPEGDEERLCRGPADLEQPLPARTGGRLGHPAPDRCGGARGHRGLRAAGHRLGAAAEALARVVRHRIRGRFEPAGPGRSRRRGDDARAAPALPDPPGRAEGADRAGASGRLAVGRNPGEILGRRADLGGRSGRQGARAGLKSGAGINPTTEGAPMDILEIEQKETLSREEAAARLKRFAEMLSKNNDLEFERGGMQIKVHVPDEVRLKVELELETDERELEIELTW